MPGYLTSYSGLFTPTDSGAPVVTSIDIPLIQRDYAQGRTGTHESAVRARFLDVLYDALSGGEPVGLDFIYGEVQEGRLQPLDGQQRLTTLFLLHWYLGYRAGRLAERQPWMNFSYATRPSARMFCQRLVAASPPPETTDPGAWIVDQSWYLYVWRNDPTIQAMLVMINAIHQRFRDSDPEANWDRLVSVDNPAISFQLLPIDDMGSGEELYIKMNSRGKPLTPFENFKALFERSISWAGTRATMFDQRIDGAWSDVMWRFRGSYDIDNRFMHYISFITDVCEWRLGRLPKGPFDKRAFQLFGTQGDEAIASMDLLFHAFETWVGVDVGEAFRQLFTRVAPSNGAEQPLVLFGTDQNIDLFDACCRNYDNTNKGRFSYGRALLLYAVLLDRYQPSADFPRRLRVVRNLVEASENEFRPHRLPALLEDVQRIVVEGSVEEIKGFNRAQAEDEQAKSEFLAVHPDLAPAVRRLEDHDLLHGWLEAFELDAETFGHRVTAFHLLMSNPQLWPDLAAALLATGEYARRVNDRDLQFGSPTNRESWRKLLTGTARANLASTARVLAKVLDAVANGPDPEAALQSLQEVFLLERTETGHFDWRYYLVRYNAMREGASGIYASVGGKMGYRVYMLDKTQLNGYFRDPYLTALVREAGVEAAVDDGATGPYFIGGYIDDERWMKLTKSRTALRCASDGFVLRAPPIDAFLVPFHRVCADFGIGPSLKLATPQQSHRGILKDTEDRVEHAATVLRALVDAGL